MRADPLLSEAELARRANVDARTVRTLRERGVIEPSGMTPAGVRLYAPGTIALVLGTVRRPAAIAEIVSLPVHGAALLGIAGNPFVR